MQSMLAASALCWCASWRSARLPPAILTEVPMRLIGLVVVLVASLTFSPITATAQQTGKVYRIGVLTLVSAPEFEEVFLQSFKERGYVEGQNFVLEWRRADGKTERLADLAADLVGRRMDVIVTASNAAALAAKAATTTIPIVMTTVGGPEQRGLVASLSKPGGNVTGLTLDAGPEIAGKMLELLKEAAPKTDRVALLSVDANPNTTLIWTGQANTAARALGLQLQRFVIKGPDQLSVVLADIVRERQDALLDGGGALTFSLRRPILEFAAKNRLPGVYAFRAFADEGGLMSYGVDLKDLFRRAPIFVDKILKGAKPADLPVEQPTKFELVINLKTAKALGLTIPQPLLLRADEIIQ
jgi:ABC-type uncharacterized transport system substrate-binding protein